MVLVVVVVIIIIIVVVVQRETERERSQSTLTGIEMKGKGTNEQGARRLLFRSRVMCIHVPYKDNRRVFGLYCQGKQ